MAHQPIMHQKPVCCFYSIATIEILCWASRRPIIEVHTESIVTNCIKVSIVPGTDAKLTFKMSSVSACLCKSSSFFINSSVGLGTLQNIPRSRTVYLYLPLVWSMDKETGQMAKIRIENNLPILGQGSTPRQAKIYSVKRIKASVENMALCEVRSPYTSRQTVPYWKIVNRDQLTSMILVVDKTMRVWLWGSCQCAIILNSFCMPRLWSISAYGEL